MLSYIVNRISNSIFNNEHTDNEIINDQNNHPRENVQDILARVNEIRHVPEQIEIPQLNLVDDEAGCFYKTGTVTLVQDTYVLVDNLVCEMKYVIPDDIKKGDEVYYLAYKINRSEELKIRKILEKTNDKKWDVNETDHNENQQSTDLETEPDVNLNVANSSKVDKKRSINQRTVVGKVSSRKGRQIFLEDDTCVDLDKVEADFVPFIGDWVKLDCKVEVDEERSDLKGEILQITSLSAVRQISKIGKITAYNEGTESGTIEKIVVFTKASCAPGYIPCVGDKVVVQSIESDQGVQLHWRALQVVPMEDVCFIIIIC